jgi:anti-sigma factor RsiW
MSLCESIDTLSMAYLDDELAAEERREVELHLTECASCRDHLEGERADQSLLRKALVAPAAPDLLRAKLARVLDAEDRVIARAERRRWSSYVLPGSAVLAAAAAIAVFVAVRPPEARVNPFVTAGIHGVQRNLPVEAHGPAIEPWVQEHFASLKTPQFDEPGTNLLGVRDYSIVDHDTAMFSWEVNTGRRKFLLVAYAMEGVSDEELDNVGQPIQVGTRTIHLVQQNGEFAVTFRGSDHRAYMFLAPAISPENLVRLVVSSNLFGDN